MKRILFALFALAAAAGTARAEDPMPVVNPPDLHWKPKDALPPGAFGAVVHGDPARGNYDFIGKFPDGFTVPMHYHTYDVNVVMLKGSMVIARDGQADREIVEGGFFFLPAGMPYVARCARACMFLVHGDRPFDIIYSRPEDDPRPKRAEPAPVPDLGQLRYFLGNWRCAGSYVVDGKEHKSGGPISMVMAYGDQWLLSRTDDGLEVYGFDPVGKVLVSHGFDKDGVSTATSKGWIGDRQEWEGVYVQKGKAEALRWTITRRGDRRYEVEGQSGAETFRSTCDR